MSATRPIDRRFWCGLRGTTQNLHKAATAARAFARPRGDVEHSETVVSEKARALLGKQRRTVQHIPSMPYAELPAFYERLADMQIASALALRFLILTATRTSEVRFCHADELDGTVWVIPAERTKTKREYRVPLWKKAEPTAIATKSISYKGPHVASSSKNSMVGSSPPPNARSSATFTASSKIRPSSACSSAHWSGITRRIG